jgi:integrase/recombinase XerD
MPKRKAAPSGTFWRNGVLYGRSQVGGADIKFSLHTDDPEVAKTRLKVERERIVAAVHHGDLRRTFDDALARWAEELPHQVGHRTADRYGSSLGMLKPWLDGKYLDEIDGALVAEVIKERRKSDRVTNATIKRDLVALSSVMNYAIDQGWREDNPVLARMKRLKEQRDPIVLPERASVLRMVERAPGMFSKLIEAAWKTGCRQSELVKSKHAHLNHARQEFTVIGKRNKLRTISLKPFGGYEVFRSLPPALGGAWIFWHDNGQSYANVSSRFRALTLDLVRCHNDYRPFRFHDLRHLHAVEWLQSGRSIYDLQQRLGHESIKTTELYLKYLDAEQQRVVKEGHDQDQNQAQQAASVTDTPA